MRAMILAAGRGERMRPLTDHTPKPLLTVHNKPLIVYHIEAMADAGIHDIVINVGHLPQQFEATLGDGQKFGVNIHYSYEELVLETGGGIVKALPLLGTDPFLVVSGDILTDFSFVQLPKSPIGLAHLVMVNNPSHHPRGDYALADGYVQAEGENLLNFAGIGVYRPELFESFTPTRFRLPSVFQKPLQEKLITGEHYKGLWHNIGTVEQLQHVNKLSLDKV
jgi:MurNAc alpha-1-phosphate uridylyltransferase